MKNNNPHFRSRYWLQQYQKLSNRITVAIQQRQLNNWSDQRVLKVWRKLEKLSARLNKRMKPALLMGFLSTGLIVQKESLASTNFTKENPFAPDAEVRKLPIFYQERAYLSYQYGTIDATSNLDFASKKYLNALTYQLNQDRLTPKNQATFPSYRLKTSDPQMWSIQMDKGSDLSANYGIYGGSPNYQLCNSEKLNDPPITPEQPKLVESAENKESPTLKLAGKAQAQTIITLESDIDGVIATNIQVNEQGEWQLELEKSLSKGQHKIIAKASNESGSSEASKPLYVVTGGFTTTGTVVHNTNIGHDFVFGSDQLGDSDSNKNARFFFDKSKAAFRAGEATGSHWDDANVGQWSTVGGGSNNSAEKLASTVSGGFNNVVSGGVSTVGGGGGNQAVEGYSTISGGRFNTAMGEKSSIGGGQRNLTEGKYSTIPGGKSLVAQAYGETALGIFNDTTGVSANKTGITTTDRLFVIGNGADADNRSNALVMLKNGNTQLNGILSLSNGTDTLNLPNTKGTSGQVLTTDGIGNASWVSPNVISPVFETTGNVTSNSPGDLTKDDFVFGSDQLNDKTGFDDNKRFFFDKSKGAWRAGGVNGTQWNVDSLGQYSTVSGGENNTAKAAYSSIGGGDNNHVSGEAGTVAGGYKNIVNGDYGSIAGGYSNKVTGTNSAISGGFSNNVSGNNSVISGGKKNLLSGNYAIIGGGTLNKAIAKYATISGGFGNNTYGNYAVVGGGNVNKANAEYATISGGTYNLAKGILSTIGGGYGNIVSAKAATIPGGYALGATSYGEIAMGLFNDTTGVTPNKTGFTGTDRLFVIGNGQNSSNRSNALVMLKNGNTHLNGMLSLSNGTDTLNLPNTKGLSGQVLTADGMGNADWMTVDIPNTSPFSTQNNVTSNAPGDFTQDDFVFGSTQLDNIENSAHNSKFFFDKSKAAFRAGIVSGTQWNDNNVGINSTVSGGNNNMASDAFSFIGGGQNNQATNFSTVVSGGFSNTASGIQASVGGGSQNTASGNQSTVGGGDKNTASGNSTTVGGGKENLAQASYATASGGNLNKATGSFSSIGGGINNTASNHHATIGGGSSNNATSRDATIGGGYQNMAIASKTTISGGTENKASGIGATIAGGNKNSATANYSSIAGGKDLRATSFGETAIGLFNDTTGLTPQKTFFQATDRLFVIGNGRSANNRSNALVMLKNGDTHLNGSLTLSNGTDTLKLPNDKGIAGQILTSDGMGNAEWMNLNGAFTNTGDVTHNTNLNNDFVFGSTQTGNAGGTADDSRFFFDKSKAAFRAGKVDGAQWEESNIGQYSTVTGGDNNQASGDNSFIGSGLKNIASGIGAVVSGGFLNKATESFSGVLGGGGNEATGFSAVVSGGRINKAIGGHSAISGGSYNQVSGEGAFIGGGNRNKSNGEFAVITGGENNTTTADFSTITGGTGLATTAYGETVIGIFNDTTGTAQNKTGFSLTDRLFVIGNGTDNDNRSNAMVILKNGNTHLNGMLSLSNGTDTLNLPNTKGLAGQILTSDGAGNADWADGPTAASLSNIPAGNIAATNIQAAINELDTEKLSVEIDGSVTNEIQDLSSVLDQGTDAGGNTIANLLAINSTHGAKLTPEGIWMNASDRHHKTNIQTLEYGLDEILALHPVTYDYKKGGSHSLGFIAQEVEKILPELVEGKEGDKALAYSLMTSVIVKAMQEMDANQDKLEEEITALQQKNEALKQMQAKISQLESENQQLKTMQLQMERMEKMMAQLVEESDKTMITNSKK